MLCLEELSAPRRQKGHVKKNKSVKFGPGGCTGGRIDRQTAAGKMCEKCWGVVLVAETEWNTAQNDDIFVHVIFTRYSRDVPDVVHTKCRSKTTPKKHQTYTSFHWVLPLRPAAPEHVYHLSWKGGSSLSPEARQSQKRHYDKFRNNSLKNAEMMVNILGEEELKIHKVAWGTRPSFKEEAWFIHTIQKTSISYQPIMPRQSRRSPTFLLDIITHPLDITSPTPPYSNPKSQPHLTHSLSSLNTVQIFNCNHLVHAMDICSSFVDIIISHPIIKYTNNNAKHSQ